MNELWIALAGAAAAGAVASLLRTTGMSKKVDELSADLTLVRLNAAKLESEVGRLDERLRALREVIKKAKK